MKESDQMATCQTSSLAIQPAGQCCLLTKNEISMKASSSSKSAEHRYIDLALNTTVENTNGQMIQNLTSSNLLERKCYGAVQMFDCGVNIPVIQPKNEAKDESRQAPQNGKSVLIASGGNLNNSNMRKGKEQVTYETEKSKSSQESEDSNGSVESCSTMRLMSTGKRARGYDFKMSLENKRFKKQIHEGSSSGSFLRQESSFMNWVSAITNGFSQLHEVTPLSSVPPPSHCKEGNPNYLSSYNVEGKDMDVPCRDMGFKSMFQSLYLPGFKGKHSTNVYYPTNNEAAKELKVESEQFDYNSSQKHLKKVGLNLHKIFPTKGERVNGASKDHSGNEWFKVSSLHIVCDGDSTELHNEVSMPGERLNKNVHQVKEFPSTKSNVAHSGSMFRENKMCDFKQTGNLSNTGSTCSSPKNGSLSPPCSKGAGTLVAIADSPSKLVSNNKSELLQNLWIARFFPRVSSTKPKSVQHMQGMDLATESLTKNYNVVDPLFQNNVAYSKDQGCSENSCLSLVQGETKSHGCHRAERLKTGDQKLESKLNPILPSHKFQKMEPMVSTLAKRLDACRYPEL